MADWNDPNGERPGITWVASFARLTQDALSSPIAVDEVALPACVCEHQVMGTDTPTRRKLQGGVAAVSFLFSEVSPNRVAFVDHTKS